MRNSKYFECVKLNWENRDSRFESGFENVVVFNIYFQHHFSDKRYFSVFCPKSMAGSNNQMVSWFS